MIEKQTLIPVSKDQLLEKVKECLQNHYRLVQIGCSKIKDTFEITYSFDKNFEFIYFKLILDFHDTVIPSISSIYWGAFLYENEIHDLYGINVTGIAVDYKGNFYKTTMKTPFIEEKKE